MTEPTARAAEPQLEYGLARPRPWWKGRRMIVLLVVLPLAGWLFYNREDLSHRVRRHYWSRQCMSFVIPPDTKLVEADEKRIGDLAIRNPDYMVTARGAGMSSPEVKAVFFPRCLREMAEFNANVYVLRGINGVGNLPSDGYPPITFLHERSSAGGQRFLVIVSGSWTNALDLEKYTDYVTLPVPSFSDPLVPPLRWQKAFQYSGAVVKADLHPGVADPADASHFTIPYDVEGQRHTLHGSLQDDGTVKFSKE